MKILYDNNIFAIQKYGGISRYYIELIRTLLLEYPFEVSPKILSGLHRNDYLKYSQLDLGSSLIYLPNFKGAGALLPKINYGYNSIFGKVSADICHATYYKFPKRLPFNTKKIITVYDLIHELYPMYFKKNDQTSLIKAKAIEEADHILAISKNTKQDLIDIYKVAPEKITVTYLGVDHLNAGLKKNGIRKNFLLFVGPRNGYKNFRNLLIAFSRLLINNRTLKLVAFGGGNFTEDEKIFIKSLNIKSDNLQHITGPDQILLDLYSQALAFVYPSIYEGFGIPPLEAMGNGCPVIASETSSIAEVLGSAALLFDPNNVDEIMDKIESVIDDLSLRESLVTKGYKQIEQYTWKENAKATLKAYKKLEQ